jgi:Flp pilus assembly protein TadD
MQTGMGRSLYRPVRAGSPERWGESVYDAHSNFGYFAHWLRDSLFITEFRLDNRDTIHMRRERIDYVIGSGHQTRSYLLERNGFLYEAPLTWYTQKQRWDLSPGYENGNNSRFDRPITPECLHCHAAYSQPEPQSLNRYRQLPSAIDCERCHGPGAEHVARMQRDEVVDVRRKTDYSIVNPKRLSIDRQFDVCSQCHLQGIQVPSREQPYFRPGEPLGNAFHVFLVERDPSRTAFGIASQAERLRLSACFKSGQLTCTTCHDPHTPHAAVDKTAYLRTCQKCHQQDTCTAPRSARVPSKNNCISCHMAQGAVSDIPHVSFTDHYIRRQLLTARPSASATPAERTYLELLCATQAQPSEELRARAIVRLVEQLEPQRTDLLATALPHLPGTAHSEAYTAHSLRNEWSQAARVAREWTRAQPELALAHYRSGYALFQVDDLLAATHALHRSVMLSPHWVEPLLTLGDVYLKRFSGQQTGLDSAGYYYAKARELQPFNAKAWTNSSFIELNKRQYELAETYARKAVALNPDAHQARMNLVIALIAQQKRDEATTIAQKHKSALSKQPLWRQISQELSIQ